MSRVDVPTLMCDRCGLRTQDTSLMASFHKITHRDGPGHQDQDWDLCPGCWKSFKKWFDHLAGGDE